MRRNHNPMPIVCPIWEHDWSDYPDRVRVSVDTGVVLDYVRAIKQPAPVFKESLDRFTALCTGYPVERKGKHEVR